MSKTISTNFHNLDFIFFTNEPQESMEVYQSIVVKYENGNIYCANGSGEVSLYIKDTYLCFDCDIESKRIGAFGGMINLDNANKTTIAKPNKYEVGILYLDTDKELVRGIGYRFDCNDKICYDKDTHILQVGDYDKTAPLLRFLGNVYCQIKNSRLHSVLITDIV